MNRTANNLSNLNSFFVANVFAEVNISDSDLESRIEKNKNNCKHQFGFEIYTGMTKARENIDLQWRTRCHGYLTRILNPNAKLFL
jgi:hypothetical protein